MAIPILPFRSWLLLGCLSGALQAQVVRDEASPDLEAGLVARLDTTFRKHDDGDVTKSQARRLVVPAAEWRDFSVSLHFFSDSAQHADPVSLLRGSGWSLTITNQKEVRLEIESPAGTPLVLTAPLLLNRPSVPEQHHLAFSVRRDPRQALTGLWVDGVELAAGALPPGRLAVPADGLVAGDDSLRGALFEVRVYDRALSRPEILELGQWRPESDQTRPKTLYSFELAKDEVLAVLGGTEAVAVVEEGTLETLLLSSHAEHKPRLRSLAWEADTVFRQDRPLNFGDLPLQLRRCGATAVLLMFGRQECLERGAAGVAEFETAYDRLLSQVQTVTPRLIVAEAAPFEAKPKPLPDLSARNADLALYNAALRRLAEKHGAYYASSGEGWNHARPQPLTRDGVNLTETGAREVGLRVLTATSRTDLSELEPLRTAVRAKNRLWHQYWRPDNWAFLHGDRTAQPSSRDHLNPQLRWFPAELERYQKLIADKENELWKLAEERKVP